MFYTDGGAPMHIITACALLSALTSLLQLFWRGKRDLGGLAAAFTAATLMAGIWGYGMGQYLAHSALAEAAAAEELALLQHRALVAGGANLSWAGLLSALCAVLGGIAWTLHRGTPRG